MPFCGKETQTETDKNSTWQFQNETDVEDVLTGRKKCPDDSAPIIGDRDMKRVRAFGNDELTKRAEEYRNQGKGKKTSVEPKEPEAPPEGSGDA